MTGFPDIKINKKVVNNPTEDMDLDVLSLEHRTVKS